MSDRDSFERAFVAVRYLLGARSDLLVGLGTAGEPARDLSRKLCAESQQDRARTLAGELIPIATALDARRLR
jgi:hypothetical protein